MNKLDAECRQLAEQEQLISEQETMVLLLQEFFAMEELLWGGLCARFLRDGDGKVVFSVYRRGESRSVFREVLRPRELNCVRRVYDDVTRVYSKLKAAGLVRSVDERDPKSEG